MNKDFLKNQKTAIEKALTQVGETDVAQKKDLSILYNFVCSLLEPDKSTDIRKEDLRKLALELGYSEDTKFEDWTKKGSGQ